MRIIKKPFMTKLKTNDRIFAGTYLRNIKMEPERKELDAKSECFVSNLNVNLTIAIQIRADECCKMMVFDDRGQAMGWASYLTDAKDATRKELRKTMMLVSSKAWFAGRYVMLLRYDGIFVLRITWELDANHKFTPVECTLCDYVSDEEEMLEYFFSDITQSMRIHNHPGMRQVIAMLLRRFHQTSLNVQREIMGMDNLRLCRHYMIETRCNLRLSQIGNAINQVGLFRGKYAEVDCGTLCLDATDLSTSFGTGSILTKGFNPEEYDSRNEEDRKEHTILLYNVGALLRKGGKSVLLMLANYLRSVSYNFLLMGTRQELDELLDQNPSLANYFLPGNRMVIETFSDKDLVQLFLLNCEKNHLHLSDAALTRAYKLFQTAYMQGKAALWGDDEMGDIVRKTADAYTTRCIRGMQESFPFDVTEVQPEDIDDFSVDCSEDEYEQAMADLHAMIGLQEIKKDISTLANRMRFFAKREQLGLPANGNTVHHAIFTGNPGTGKTTVARMLGRIYHSLGLLSKGEVIAVDRRRIVGQYIGETENNMDQILQEAQGNVLFVDEAYTLYSNDDSRDFGRHAVECLLTVLSQKNPDMLIVFAGYEKEMDRLMSMNPGLVGRFPYKLRFADYNADELVQIADRLFRQEQYVLTDEARRMLCRGIEKVVGHHSKSFSNARWVEQFVNNGIIPAMADRLSTAPHAFTKETYQTVEAADVETALQKYNPQTLDLTRRRVVGF